MEDHEIDKFRIVICKECGLCKEVPELCYYMFSNAEEHFIDTVIKSSKVLENHDLLQVFYHKPILVFNKIICNNCLSYNNNCINNSDFCFDVWRYGIDGVLNNENIENSYNKDDIPDNIKGINIFDLYNKLSSKKKNKLKRELKKLKKRVINKTNNKNIKTYYKEHTNNFILVDEHDKIFTSFIYNNRKELKNELKILLGERIK
jgi:hypothetical protein